MKIVIIILISFFVGCMAGYSYSSFRHINDGQFCKSEMHVDGMVMRCFEVRETKEF